MLSEAKHLSRRPQILRFTQDDKTDFGREHSLSGPRQPTMYPDSFLKTHYRLFLSTGNRFFVPTNSLDMLTCRSESSPHRVDRDMCGTKRAPHLRLANQLIQIALTSAHSGFNAKGGEIATFFLEVTTQVFNGLAHRITRWSQGKPPISNTGSAAQRHIGC